MGNISSKKQKININHKTKTMQLNSISIKGQTTPEITKDSYKSYIYQNKKNGYYPIPAEEPNNNSQLGSSLLTTPINNDNFYTKFMFEDDLYFSYKDPDGHIIFLEPESVPLISSVKE